MGREIKRVPLNFDWPLNQPWRGFVNPYSAQKCRTCDGTGYSQEAKKLDDAWYSFDKQDYIQLPNGRRYNNAAWQYHLDEDDVKALLDADRLWDFTREPINDEQRAIVKEKVANGENSWLPFNNGYVPTPEEVNEWAKHGMGHDSVNNWTVVKAKCNRLNIPSMCEVCEGTGELWATPDIKKAADDWQDFEPPIGIGWQLWETVSEGSPITPVFDTKDALVEYLVNSGDIWNHKWTRTQAEAMVNEKWVMSGLMSNGKFMRAPEAVEELHKNKKEGRIKKQDTKAN